MKKVESLSVNYVGYKSPENIDELEFEILGLHTVIAVAQQRISVLRQSIKLGELLGENNNEETVQKAPDTEKTEQEG